MIKQGGPFMHAVRSIVTLVILALALGGCALNEIIRPEARICQTDDSDAKAKQCASASIEQHAGSTVSGKESDGYVLGFVEFDDQGEPYKREQITELFNMLNKQKDQIIKGKSAAKGLCLMIFVHGWKHNAEYDDTNVMLFRQLLARTAQMELQLPNAEIKRKVVGIYI